MTTLTESSYAGQSFEGITQDFEHHVTFDQCAFVGCDLDFRKEGFGMTGCRGVDTTVWMPDHRGSIPIHCVGNVFDGDGEWHGMPEPLFTVDIRPDCVGPRVRCADGEAW